MKIFGEKKKADIRKKYTAKGIVLRFTSGNPPLFPLNRNDSDTLSKLLPEGGLWAAMECLWSDGFLTDQADNSWIVPYNIYQNYDFAEDSDLFYAIDLPLPIPLETEVNIFRMWVTITSG